MLKSYDEIIESACKLGPEIIAVAKPESEDVVIALEQARKKYEIIDKKNETDATMNIAPTQEQKVWFI